MLVAVNLEPLEPLPGWTPLGFVLFDVYSIFFLLLYILLDGVSAVTLPCASLSAARHGRQPIARCLVSRPSNQVQVEKSPDGSSRPQELRDVGDRRRANSVARSGGQVTKIKIKSENKPCSRDDAVINVTRFAGGQRSVERALLQLWRHFSGCCTPCCGRTMVSLVHSIWPRRQAGKCSPCILVLFVCRR